MASNLEKAAEIVYNYGQTTFEKSLFAARALSAEGVLAPDLPAPSRTMFPGGRVWYIDGPVGDVRATITGTVVAFGTWQEQPFRIVSTPEEMRTLARTLEAAAAHAEKADAHAETEVTDV